MTLKEIASFAIDEVMSSAEDESVFAGIKSEFGKQHVRKTRPSELKSKSLEEHDERFHPDGYKEGDTCELREKKAKLDKADSDVSGKSLSDRISVDVCDITKESVDAIVNAANRWMLGGGGVDGAIHRAAGPQLVEECRTYEPDEHGFRVQTGEAKITKGYNLPAKHVIHTAGPDCRDPEMSDEKDQDKALSGSYRNSLELAKENGLKTVAFPSISTGIFGFPLERAAKIAAREIVGFLKDNPAMSVKMCIYDPFDSNKIKTSYEQAFQERIDELTKNEDSALARTCDIEDWGDLESKKRVVGNGKPEVAKDIPNGELRQMVEKAAFENVRNQSNYIGDTELGQPQLNIGGITFRLTKGGIKHGLRRGGKYANANASCLIGDLLNSSVKIPNTPDGVSYRIAGIDFGEGLYFVNITSHKSESVEEIDEVDVLHAVNTKSGAAFHGLTRSDSQLSSTIKADEVSISQLHDAWQTLFYPGLKNVTSHHAVATDEFFDACDAMDAQPNQPMTDLQKHDAKFHGGHYDGQGECKFREGMAREDSSDKLAAAESEEAKAHNGVLSKALAKLRSLVRPPEPPQFDGLTGADIAYLDASAKNLAFLAQRVCRNIEKGKPGPGTQALQGYQDTDEKRLAAMMAKDKTGQVKVIYDLLMEAKRSEANGWNTGIEVPGHPYNSALYDAQDPSGSTGYASWKPDAEKFPKDPHASARLAYESWVPPSDMRKSGVSAARALLQDKEASATERDAANSLIESNDALTDIEGNVGGLINAYDSESNRSVKDDLGNLLSNIASGGQYGKGYEDYQKQYDSALKGVMAYQANQALMKDGETVDDIAARMAAKGMYVPPLMKTAWNKLQKITKDAVKNWKTAISRISGGEAQAKNNFKNNIKAMWDSDDVDVLVNAPAQTVVYWLADPAKGGRNGKYESSGLDYDYMALGQYNFDANYVNAREQHKYCGIFPKGSTGRQAYGNVEVVLDKKKVVGFVSGPHSCTRGSGYNGKCCFLPQNANLSSYWDSDLIRKDMSKEENAGRKILSSFGATPEFWAVGDLTRDMISRIRFDSASEANVILKDPDIVKFLKASGIKVEVANKGELSF